MKVRQITLLVLAVCLGLILMWNAAAQGLQPTNADRLYAYVADGSAGLRVVDVSNPAAPYEVGFYDTPGDAQGVFVAGGYAYVADGDDGLRVIDVLDPSSPHEVGFLGTPRDAQGVFVAGGYAYVADGDSGLRVVDVSNPAVLREVGFHDTPGYAWNVFVVGGYAYVADDWTGLRVVDVSNPSAPRSVGSFPGSVKDVFVDQGYAYLAEHDIFSQYSGLRVVDVSNPAAPREAGFVDILPRDWAYHVFVAGGYAYVSSLNGGLYMIDVSNPAAPRQAGYYGLSSNPNPFVVGSYAYVANGSDGLRVLDVTNPAAPYEVGIYDTPGSASDVFVAEGAPGPTPTPTATPSSQVKVQFRGTITEIHPPPDVGVMKVQIEELLSGPPISGEVDVVYYSGGIVEPPPCYGDSQDYAARVGDRVEVYGSYEPSELGDVFTCSQGDYIHLLCVPSRWRGEYHDEQSLTGAPVFVRCDDAIDFNWGSEPPDPALPADHFFVFWYGTPNFAEGGRYRFHTLTSDGVRLRVDGQSLIDQWHDQEATEYTAEIDLSAGQHEVRMDYYENTGEAIARLWWEEVGAPQTYSISGRVTDSLGKPVFDATVTATGPVNRSIQTDTDGRYGLSDLPAGTYSVSASQPVACPNQTATQTVTVPPSATNVSLVLPCQTYFISGRVTDADTNDPIPGVTVTHSGPSAGYASTGSDGRYTMYNVPAGTYTLTPSKSGYTFSPATRTVSVPPDVAEQDFAATLSGQVGHIIGMVRSTNNQPIPEATVSLGRGIPDVQTDTEGQYHIPNVPPGIYTIVARANGYQERGYLLSVDAGRTVERNFALSLNDPRQKLAERFAPILHMHSDDWVKEPKHVDIMVENSYLRQPNGHSWVGPGGLTSEMLATTYAGGAYRDYTLDLPPQVPIFSSGETRYRETYEQIEGNYPSVVYASVKTYHTTAPTHYYTTLQYWFFYYYNDWGTSLELKNQHEGDWEQITLVFESSDPGLPDENAVPIRATYAQHAEIWPISGHESRPWPNVPKQGEHPEVFVGRGSHASYFTSGPHQGGRDVTEWRYPIAQVKPEVVLIPDGTQPSSWGPVWLNFLGRWGEKVTPPPLVPDFWSGPLSLNDPQRKAFQDPLCWAMARYDPLFSIRCALTAQEATEAKSLARQRAFVSNLTGDAELHVYDASGRHLGPDGRGGVEGGIPDGQMFEFGSSQLALISQADLVDRYTLRIAGKGTESVRLTVSLPNAASQVVQTLQYFDVSNSAVMRGEVRLAPDSAFTLRLDLDGNGTYETEKQPDVNEQTPLHGYRIHLPLSLKNYSPGQQPARYTISGRVTDGAGTPIPGATVSATGPTNVSTTTGSDGRYTLSNLPAGTYTVSASKIGYTSPLARSVAVPPSQTGIDFTVRVGVGQIIFSSSRGGNPLDIYLMNEDGSNIRRLTDAPGFNEFAKVSHDGRKVVFQSTRTGIYQVYIMDIDGRNVRQLTNNCASTAWPSWSPDDTRIVFDCDHHLAFINSDGSGFVKTDIVGSAPDWSPDGTKIAFVRWMGSDGDWEIFSANTDGSHEVRLTHTPNAEWLPAWSPDGSKIAFCYSEGLPCPVYVMNGDGSNRTRLADATSITTSGPRWAPDGQRIVFVSDRDGNKEIYAMNSDGSNQTRLTNDPARDDSPFWFAVSPASQPTPTPTRTPTPTATPTPGPLPDKFLFAIGAQAPMGQFNLPSRVAVAPDGTVYVADTSNRRIQHFSATGEFLGAWGSWGSANGQLSYPEGLTVAPDGTVYVADTWNHRIQRFSPTGQFLGKWGGRGSDNGQFDAPMGVAVAPDGTVYVVDNNNHRIQRFSATGQFLSKWGSHGSGDGQFDGPSGVAVAPDGTVYVVDSNNHRVQHFSATGQFLETWGSWGHGHGELENPAGVAVALNGTVYVADTDNSRIQYFTAEGQFLGTWGSWSSGGGQFHSPGGVAVAPDGTLYVADTGNHRIQRFSSTGQFLGTWGSEGSSDGQFTWPRGIAVAPDGTVYVADTGNHRIQRFTVTGQFLGKWGSQGNGDGQFDWPSGVAMAPDGTVYVADTGNHRIQRFSATGQFLGKWGSQGNGAGQFNTPTRLAVALDGTVYVADTNNHRIQRFTATGQFLSQWGSRGSDDGQFNFPLSVTVAQGGTVYVTDADNRVQRFSATGQFLGTWGFWGSGEGQFAEPEGVAVAPGGTVYVADTDNHRIQAFGTAYPTTWRGEYFANRWLADMPVLIRQEATIDFDWEAGSPGPGVPADNFSARWQRYVWFEADTYQFTVSADDGVRLWVDDRLLIDHWQDQIAAYSADISLDEGYHRVRLEYYEHEGSAAVHLSWAAAHFQHTRTFGETGAPYFEDTDHLNGPVGLGTDGTDVWIVECEGQRALKYASDGTFRMKIGKAGVTDASGAKLWCPKDVAVDPDGNIWVVNEAHDVLKFGPSGSRVGGLGVMWGSGTGNDRFDDPHGIASDSAGHIYISDSGNHRIQVFNGDGTYITTIGETGVPGMDNGHFNGPRRIAVDNSNRLYVADAGNHRVQVFDVSNPSAITYVATIGTSGEAGSDNAHFDSPQGVAVDATRGRIYIADGFNQRVQMFDYITRGYLGTLTGFGYVADVAVDAAGNLYVAEPWKDKTQVQQFDSNLNYKRTYGTTGVPYLTDGYHYKEPHGVTVDSAGNLLFVEYTGHRLVKLNAAGEPQFTFGEAGVNGPDNAHLSGPISTAVDSAGNIYVADQWNHRVQILNSSGTYVATLGTGWGSGNYEFKSPGGVAVDRNGYIYVGDTDNHRVQIYNSSREYVATLGVTGSCGSDNAHFCGPFGVTVDAAGNIYVADAWNQRVQKFNSSYVWQMTLGTTGEWGSDLNHFAEPRDVAIDVAGNIYVADIYNNRVQVFDSSGTYLTTISSWDRSTNRMREANSVDVDVAGNVYITDGQNHRTLKFASRE